jgi:hypothetical protein
MIKAWDPKKSKFYTPEPAKAKPLSKPPKRSYKQWLKDNKN